MQCPICGSHLERLGYLNYQCPNCSCDTCHDPDCNDPECNDPNHLDMECKPIFGSTLTCPECGSTTTKIKNDHYICCDCNHEYGYVVGSRVHCPVCQSPHIKYDDGFYHCQENNCGKIFGNKIDDEIEFPHNVIFPTRKLSEFYRRKIFGQGKGDTEVGYLEAWFSPEYLHAYFDES